MNFVHSKMDRAAALWSSIYSNRISAKLSETRAKKLRNVKKFVDFDWMWQDNPHTGTEGVASSPTQRISSLCIIVCYL